MKKIFKSLLIAFASLFTLVILALFIGPLLFRDELEQLVKDTANEQLSAKVDFGSFDLSIISTFPDFSFEIHDVEVVGVEQFEGDTLIHLGQLNLELNLMSVIGGNYKINSFELNDLTANVFVLEDGTANYDIVKASDESGETEKATKEDTSSSPFKFDLDHYAIKNVNIVYHDRMGGMYANIDSLSHQGQFSMNGDSLMLNTRTITDGITYEMNGVRYANEVKLAADADLSIDLASMYIRFMQNEIKLNDLILGIDGAVELGDESQNFDLKLLAKHDKFQELFTLIPAVYQEGIQGVDTKGSFHLDAFLKGEMKGEQMPAYGANLSVKDAYFKYPNLPESVDNIQVELHVNNPTGAGNDLKLDLQLFHFEIAKNPIDFTMQASNLELDPTIAGRVQSKMNLEHLEKAIPLADGEKYQGRLNANFTFAGKMSSVEQEQYEDFKADGQISLMDFLYKSKHLPDVQVKNLYMNFSPHYFELGNIDALIGKSDINAKGRFDNILPYVFHGDTLTGEFEVSSSYFDLNQFISEDSAEVSQVEEGQVVQLDSTSVNSGVLEVPGDIYFKLKSSFKKVDFDNMPIEDFSGDLVVKDGRVQFQDAQLKLLGGEISLNGTYDTHEPSKPKTEMQLGIKGMDIPVAFKTFNTVQKLAPIAEHAKGSFSTALNYSSKLDNDMVPVYNSMNGSGMLSTKQLLVENHKLLNAIAVALKNPKYKKVKAEDLKVKYKFEEGKVKVEPFDIKLGNGTAKVHGWNSFDQTMNYIFECKIPRKEFGSEANQLLGSLEEQAKKYGAKVATGEFVLVDVIASGMVSDPKIKVRPKGLSGESSLKDQAKAAVKDKIDEAAQKAKVEAERLKKEAEEKAKAEAAKAKAEAEAKAKAALEKQKQVTQEKIDAEKKKQKNKAKDKAKDLLKGWNK